VLAIGFRNREFTVYALPALVALELIGGEVTVERLRGWLLSAVVFCAVWESIEALKPFADLHGTGHSRAAARGILGIAGRQPARPVQLSTGRRAG
jgi:hypothetical protein